MASGGGEPPKDKAEWIRNKLKALALLLEKLGIKAAEALLGIIGGIISWILNRAKDIVGRKRCKKRLRNKIKALASLSGRLGVKVAEELPGIIGVIISWVLNRAAEVVGLVSQNLWVLVVGIGGLLYMYMVTKK